MRPRDRAGLGLLLLLAGCAFAALRMAPQRPDQPWHPSVPATGVAMAGSPDRGQATRDYVLPANPDIAEVTPPAPTDPAKSFSLVELIDNAKSNVSRTRIAWNDARRAALAESAYLPKITATAVGGYQARNGRDAAAGDPSLGSSSASGAVSARALQWLLFDFGQRGAIVDAAKQQSVIYNIGFTTAHPALINNVSTAYYTDAAEQARRATAAGALRSVKAVQGAADDCEKHGVGDVIEVAQARQATAQAKLALVQATGGEQNARSALLTATGVSPLTKLRSAGVSRRKLPPSMLTPVEAIIAHALARRPDMQTTFAAQQASLAGVRAAEAEFKPKIFVFGTGAYNSGSLAVTALRGIGQQSRP